MEKAYKKQIKQLGLEVKKLREENGFTQQNLSDICEVDIRTIQRIEKGDNAIGLHLVFAISAAFGIQPSQLISTIHIDEKKE